MGKSEVCTVDGCDRMSVARGWCRLHYARWKRSGTLEARTWTRQGECTVDGCDQQSWSGGLCEMHRWRVRARGEPGPAAQINQHQKKDRRICTVDGCDRPRKGALYCHLHDSRVRRTGEPGPVQPLRAKGVVKPRKDGYVRLTMPDGRRVLAHVLVMEGQLGRRLVDGENVHHKNGIKDDNDPANLELWLVVQPTGQRVEDLMKYIAEFHAEAMLSMLSGRKAG